MNRFNQSELQAKDCIYNHRILNQIKIVPSSLFPIKFRVIFRFLEVQKNGGFILLWTKLLSDKNFRHLKSISLFLFELFVFSCPNKLFISEHFSFLSDKVNTFLWKLLQLLQCEFQNNGNFTRVLVYYIDYRNRYHLP